MNPSPPAFSDDWTQYWKHGALTTFFGGEFEVGYSGEAGAFWEALFSELPDGASIVDLATGNGAVPFIAARVGRETRRRFEIVGIDYAEIRLPEKEDIRRQMDGVDLRGGISMEATGLPARSADLVCSHFGFEYGDQDRVLDEIERLLVPEGTLALVLHHPDSAVVRQAKRDDRHTRLCIDEERLDRKVRDLVRIVGDARTPEQRARLKFNREAEQRREQINRSMERILGKIQGEDDGHVHRVAQSFLRVFADLSGQTKQQKLDFIEQSSKEFQAYAGRMRAMSAATLDVSAYGGLVESLEQRGFAVRSKGELHSEQGELIARSLVCRRSADPDSSEVATEATTEARIEVLT